MFATVGVAGLFADTAVVYALRHRFGLYVAGLLSYVVAATVTWYLNRHWTFRNQGSRRMHEEAALFLAANFAGFLLNRGTYAALVTWVPMCAAEPVLAIGAGSIAGLFSNFTLSRRLVFR